MTRLPLKSIKIEGYKSITCAETEFGAVNILIGANNVGKSNILSVIGIINSVFEGNLGEYVKQNGGANAFFRNGTKNTREIKLTAEFCGSVSELSIISDSDDSIKIEHETFTKNGSTKYHPIVVHRFHNIGEKLQLFESNRRTQSAADRVFCSNRLCSDGSNLVPFLYNIKINSVENFEKIVDTLRFVYPEFGDFVFEVCDENMSVYWTQKGCEDYRYPITAMSDATLRFTAISALLLAPECFDIIIIDEPELGLHPFAVNVLADLIHMACVNSEILISTQSIQLINNFEPEDILAVEPSKKGTVINRLDSNEIEEWLKSYTMGEIWQKNVFGANP